jgi:hypothetical protein
MPPMTVGYDDLYILSLPSFTWLKWYPKSVCPSKSEPFLLTIDADQDRRIRRTSLTHTTPSLATSFNLVR